MGIWEEVEEAVNDSLPDGDGRIRAYYLEYYFMKHGLAVHRMPDGPQPDWQPIETAPVDTLVLLYCPERGATNHRRIELGVAHSSRGSHHSWATKWRELPSPPAED